MNCRPLALWFIAALTGWFGMAWLRDSLTVSKPAPASGAFTVIAGSVPQPHRSDARSSGAESGTFSQVAARIAALPESSLKDEREKVSHRPPGAARQFALALLDARLNANSTEPADDPPDPFASNAAPADNCYKNLAESLQRNELPATSALTDWAALDPEAALAAVLSIPDKDVRGLAADAVAEVRSKSDPMDAMDFLGRAGGNCSSMSAAKIWLRADKAMEAADSRSFSLTPAQQQDIAAGLTSLVKSSVYDSPYDQPDYATLLSNAELADLARRALTRLAPGPKRLALMEALAKRNPAILAASAFGMDLQESVPEHAVIQAAVLDERLRKDPAGKDLVPDAIPPAILHAAAPRLLPQMARNGNVTGAVRLLESMTDSDVRRQVMEEILPAWMDAAPDAARAAFATAPFTALERERWEGHPAFLMHPPSGK